MSLLLNIDTATETAQVSIVQNDKLIALASNNDQKDHAGFLQVAARELLAKAGIEFKMIDAIAVAAGPGSYTGLRVGMASAKGLCYALNKPLICISSLEILAQAALDQAIEQMIGQEWLLCPMIDARRMEVFTALYDQHLTEIIPAFAHILTETSFEDQLSRQPLLFVGNGSKKWQNLCSNPQAKFCEIGSTELSMSKLSMIKYLNKQFANLAYVEPTYVKEFYSNPIR